jgi:pyruvate dehydrogenase E1 component alpha subunit
MYGNANDVAQGKQMPDHVTGRDVHFGSITSPIGTQITQAVGFAWAAKIKGEDLVSGVYFGDGATSSNDFHAGMNMAGVAGVPCVFLLRNNGWAISLPSDRQTAADAYADMGLGYGVAATRCVGNDALAVYATVDEAVKKAASGGGPTLVELITYRAGAHSTSDDPTAYRDSGEVEKELRADPIKRLRAYLERLGGWSEDEEKAFLDDTVDELKACIEQAEAAPLPGVATMFEEVYAQMPQHLTEQQAECVEGPRVRKKH